MALLRKTADVKLIVDDVRLQQIVEQFRIVTETLNTASDRLDRQLKEIRDATKELNKAAEKAKAASHHKPTTSTRMTPM